MYAPQQIQDILQGERIGPDNAPAIDLLSFDSRKVTNGPATLFFAIKSEKNDGHNYIEQLYHKGVRNFVVSTVPEFPGSGLCNFYVVANPVVALQLAAAAHRSLFTYPVIAITGSNGKTIVKEWLWQLLGTDFNAVRSPKSYNSQVGVPLSVWNMSAAHDLGIFEAGISRPDEMEKIERVIRPTLGIFTNIGEAHEKNFSSEREKIKEKLKLFKHCTTVILPADDQKILVEWMKSGYTANLVGWSFRKKGNLNIRKNADSTLSCQWKGEEFDVVPPFKDEASVENLVICITAALQLGVDPKKLVSRISGLTQVGMRLEMLEGINNTQLINDSYSADLSSLQIALDFLDQQTQYKNKTLIVSDILEAGVTDDKLYGKIASLCREKGINRLIGIGEHMGKQADKFPEGSLFYSSTEDFLAAFNPVDFGNESILIKGARIFSFERITRVLQRKVHETVLEINLNAIAHNLTELTAMTGSRKIMAMVKAAAYGSGNLEIAKLMEYHGVDYLGVAYTNEGVDLRKAGIKTPIMVMNPDPDHFEVLIDHKLEPEIFNFSGLNALIQLLTKKAIARFPVHIKIDTGMHRLGFNPSEIDELIRVIRGSSTVKVASVFSHLSSADDPQWDDFTLHQLAVFESVTQKMESALDEGFMKHIANTAGAIRFKQARLDMVRFGIGLYGVSTIAETKNRLLPTGTLKTHISQIRTVPKGETVGYSRRHVSLKDERIATVPIGYADGLSRKLGNGNYALLVNGSPAPIVGSVCMDMCMIDVTGISCSEGDEVIVFGPGNPIENLAEKLDTISYEVLTGISARVKRVFYQE